MRPIPYQAQLTWCAHLFKALTRQHHHELLPLLEKYIRKNSFVMDVGAHAGQFTKLFSYLAPDGQVYAFEPGNYALSILRKVKFMRRLTNVNIVPLGLSDQETVATLQVPVKNSGSIGFGLSNFGASDEGRKTNKERVALTTIDRFVEKNNINRLDFVKADIEGWELRMLVGARKTIEKFRPVLMLEVVDRCLARAGDTKQDLIQFLSEMKYEVFGYDEKGHLSRTADYANIICIPHGYDYSVPTPTDYPAQ